MTITWDKEVEPTEPTLDESILGLARTRLAKQLDIEVVAAYDPDLSKLLRVVIEQSPNVVVWDHVFTFSPRQRMYVRRPGTYRMRLSKFEPVGMVESESPEMTVTITPVEV